MRLLQQGDVLIKSCDEIPEGAKKVAAKTRGYVLAEGEHTGHAHVIDRLADIEFLEKDGKFYIINKSSVEIIHEEHKTITVPSGMWEVSRVLEYDHFAEEAKRVQD